MTMPSLFDLADGQTFNVAGRYEASRTIGKGRFATVFRAYDTRGARDVALKVYVDTDASAWRRSASEAKVLCDLTALNSPFFPKLIQSLKTMIDTVYHPFLVLEVGEYHDKAFPPKTIVSLQDVLDAAAGGGPVHPGYEAFWKLPTARNFCLDLCQAVSDIHSQGIVHRDLKPSNILLKRAAGTSHVYPFILDFNANIDSDTPAAGTRDYLPPEVTHGHREAADGLDDIWAVSRILWELIYGKDTSPAGSRTPVSKTVPDTPVSVFAVLGKALSTAPVDRYRNATALRDALENAFTTPQDAKKRSEKVPVPSGETIVATAGNNETPDRNVFHEARASEDRIRYSVIYTLESGDAPAVPKEMRELVALALESSDDSDVTAIDLKADLLGIGPRAFPAVLEQCYKLHWDSKDWGLSLDALESLGEANRPLAEKSLEYYCVSSSYAVRAMCMELCRRIGFLPDRLISFYAKDEGLLDLDERETLLEVLFECAKDPKVFFWLVSHMGNSMVEDPTRYPRLRDSIAVRLFRLPGIEHTTALRDFTMERLWMKMPAFKNVPVSATEELNRSVARLVGEAFAKMPGAVDKLVQWHHRVASNRSTNSWGWFVWVEFMKKTMASDPACDGRMEALKTRTGDATLGRELSMIRSRQPIPSDAIPDLFAAYIHGRDRTNPTFQKLRFDRTNAVARLLREHMRQAVSADHCERALALLEGFQGRSRVGVVRCVLDNWEKLSAHDTQRACGVLTQFVIKTGALLDDTATVLDRALRGGGGELVRSTLDTILRWK